MPDDKERLDRVEKDLTEFKLFHRDVINEIKGQGLVLVELKDYIKELAEFKNDIGTNLLLLNQSLNTHLENDKETIKRVYKTIESTESELKARIKTLEDNQRWTVRTIIGAIILAVLYELGFKST